ncbi:hypothetical protein CEXT_503381 [Caerostris extrusa]|uniref:Uncharacterized protein n=1 Tax=Caerostris extrusa TaxID=172846 RepID=A0AAV4QGB4_CAEEX|nr:hypothetical protein CEXT_503381 [Caerostris extrusa]
MWINCTVGRRSRLSQQRIIPTLRLYCTTHLLTFINIVSRELFHRVSSFNVLQSVKTMDVRLDLARNKSRDKCADSPSRTMCGLTMNN